VQEIWWADVLRAMVALGGESPEGFAKIARCLGLAVGTPAAATLDAAVTEDDDHDTRVSDAVDPDSPPTSSDAEPPSEAPADNALLERVGTECIDEPIETGDVLARPVADADALGQRRTAQAPISPRPLLAPASTTAILKHLLSRYTTDGPPDIALLVETIAHARAPIAVTGEVQQTLRFGVQVLVDVGEGMQPFRADQAQIINDVVAVVGREATEVVYFADLPTRGVRPDGGWSWTSYRYPAPGTAVLVLSDFGIGGDRRSPSRAEPRQWRQFLLTVAHHGCRAVALVPYPPMRWPALLRRHCAMVLWDRSTTVARARTANLNAHIITSQGWTAR